MGGKSFKDILWKIFRFVFLGFMALISVGPLVWIVMSSFKSNKEILSSAFALPTSLSFNGYKAALDLAPIFKFYGNSVVISFTSTLLNILIVSMAAYVLARYTFKGSTFITLLLSASLLVPTSALLMPIYKIQGQGLYLCMRHWDFLLHFSYSKAIFRASPRNWKKLPILTEPGFIGHSL